MGLKPEIHTIPTEKYTHQLVVSASDTAAEHPLWETRISYENLAADTRAVAPILLAAGHDYLGRSSGQPVTVQVVSDEQRLAYIREGLPAENGSGP